LWKHPLQFFLIPATHGRSIDRSIDGFPVPKNPSEDGWLRKKPLAPENLVIGNPSAPKESLIRNLGKMISSKKNCSSRQISEQFLFFSEEFSSSSSSSSLLLLVGFHYDKKCLGFSDLKSCQSKLGEIFILF
jgi:hypothetical protein